MAMDEATLGFGLKNGGMIILFSEKDYEYEFEFIDENGESQGTQTMHLAVGVKAMTPQVANIAQLHNLKASKLPESNGAYSHYEGAKACFDLKAS